MANHANVVAGILVDGRHKDAMKTKRLERNPAATATPNALDTGVITQAEMETLQAAERARAWRWSSSTPVGGGKRARMSA